MFISAVIGTFLLCCLLKKLHAKNKILIIFFRDFILRKFEATSFLAYLKGSHGDFLLPGRGYNSLH